MRVYQSLRTAHLERAHALDPASIVYLERNYDFSEDQLTGLDVHHVSGVKDLIRLLSRADADEVEINEPLMLSATKLELAAVATLRLRGLVRRRRIRVVSYAIGNDDPFAVSDGRLRSPWRRCVYRLATAWLVNQVDRLAVGTPGALAEYQPYLRRRRGEVRLIPALPTACETCPEPASAPPRRGVTFVGAFDNRKGLTQLLDAWPAVSAREPGTPLRLLGKGELAHVAVDAAAADPTITTLIDPARDEIHRAMREAKVLVLLSQPTPTWREQVGLPIVEGLSHGCEIVTTTETGLAEWLREHDHQVLEASDQTTARTADAIIAALATNRTALDVISSLPTVDGRLEADRWMFESGDDAVR